MCEYCGCQALATIRDLTREHDAALDVMRAARDATAAADLGAARALCAELLLLLGPHNQVEEKGLFAPMREDNPEHVDLILQEHAQVHLVLQELAVGATSSSWQERLGDALHTLREHIAKEQDGLFPAALLTLSTTQWESAERVRATVGSALPRPRT